MSSCGTLLGRHEFRPSDLGARVYALVIDDSKPVRSILRVMLSELGFEVTLATDGVEALRQLEPLPRRIW